MKATLLEISEELLALEQELETTDGDRDEAGKVVDKWLAACEKEREKLDHYAALIRDLELRAEVRKAEAQRLAERSRMDAERASFLKERMKVHFMRHELKTVETARFRITHALNGGLLPLVLSAEVESLPDAYRVEEVRYRANMEAIRVALDAGEQLDFACYGERGSSIRLK